MKKLLCIIAAVALVGSIAWQDEVLIVTSFPVDHAPVSPALGYRVDYRGRSVVISGDTNATAGSPECAR